MAVIVQDLFTAINGTLLENHVPDIGGVWTKISGTSISINTNALNNIPQVISGAYRNNTLVIGDFTINVNISTSIYNVAPISNTFYFGLHDGISTVFDNCIITNQTLFNRHSGSGFSFVSGFATLVTLQRVGANMNLYTNGIFRSTYPANGNNGYPYLNVAFISAAITNSIDNFTVETFAAPPSPPTLLSLACGV